MQNKDIFNKIVEKSGPLALATIKGDTPNVRLLMFAYSQALKKIFFLTFKETEKVKELKENRNVSFMTVPNPEVENYFRGHGICHESKHTFAEVESIFLPKNPNFNETVAAAGDKIALYEIEFSSVLMTVAPKEVVEYTI